MAKEEEKEMAMFQEERGLVTLFRDREGGTIIRARLSTHEVWIEKDVTSNGKYMVPAGTPGTVVAFRDIEAGVYAENAKFIEVHFRGRTHPEPMKFTEIY